MTSQPHCTLSDALTEHLAERGLDALPELIQVIFNTAMEAERQQFLGAGRYERTADRRGYANGFKPKTLITRVGWVDLDIPQVPGGGLYPSALERGLRSERALTLARAEMYVQCPLTPQAVTARFSPASAAFMHALLTTAVQQVIAADPVAISLLERFGSVIIQDSTTISLPTTLAAVWLGCGGSHGAGTAALTCLVRLNLCSGHLTGPLMQLGRASDRVVEFRIRPTVGSLSIRDLGYWRRSSLRQDSADGCWWLSRLYPTTVLRTSDGQRTTLAALLPTAVGAQVNVDVLLGSTERVPARLLAVRVNATVAAQRQATLARHVRAKGRAVAATRWDQSDWFIMVTNVPAAQSSGTEALVLLRARWQIERLFKRWKSDGGHLTTTCGHNPWRVLTEVDAKLLAQWPR